MILDKSDGAAAWCSCRPGSSNIGFKTASSLAIAGQSYPWGGFSKIPGPVKKGKSPWQRGGENFCVQNT